LRHFKTLTVPINIRRYTPVKSTLPNFANWRDLPAIKIWPIAALMQGFDPRALVDVAVRDLDDPKSPYGVSPGVKAGGLDTSPLVNEPPAATSPVPVAINGTAVVWTPERILEARTMRDNAKTNGFRAYAANTAKHFGMTTARLRDVLSDKSKKNKAKTPVSNWHP